MKEKYIKQIMKLLTCSKKRKEEIKQQLVSDIDAAVTSGEKEEDVIKRMGKILMRQLLQGKRKKM